MPVGRPAARSSRHWVMALAMLTALSLLLTVPRASAGPGDLDTSLNGSGMLTKDWEGTDEVRGLAIQPDGKIIAAGYTTVQVGDQNLFRFAVARFFADGSPDDGFGDAGLRRTDIDGGDAIANAVAVMGDGRIVVAGTIGVDRPEVAIARYTPDGFLDESFGGRGYITDSWSDGNDQARAVAVMESGEVVVAGLAGRRRAIARYTADGQRDTGFGDGGIAVGGAALPERAPSPAMALDVRPGATSVLLYSVAGFVRSTWQAPAEPGASLTALGSDVPLANSLDVVNAVTVGSAGMMIVGGERNRQFAVAVHSFDGNAVDVFAGGAAVAPFNADAHTALAVAVQPDGRIVAGGRMNVGDAYNITLARFEGVPRPSGPEQPEQTPTPEPPSPTPRPSTPQPTPTPEPTAPATTVPVRTPPPSTNSGRPDKGTVLFSEDFNNPSANRISLTPADAARHRRAIVNGELQLNSAASPNFVDSVNIPGEYSDLTVALDARMVGDVNQRFVMVTCRASDRGEYRLLVEPNRQRVRIVSNVRGGASTDLRDVVGNSAVAAGNGTNRIEFTCAGSLLTARINGREVASVQDVTFTSGRSWFTTNAYLGINSPTEARFDNIVITQE